MSMPYIDDELEDDEATTEKVEDFEIQGKAMDLQPFSAARASELR